MSTSTVIVKEEPVEEEAMDSSSTVLQLVNENDKPGKIKRKERKLKNEPQSVTMDDIPETVQVMDFFEARAKEFSGMVNALKKKGGSKRTFQKLPRHMRRRATSHNIKRLPYRLRDQAAAEMDTEKGTNKNASRRKRRRPGNLKLEYQSRQREKRWLETHIWHAKRMKMVTKWKHRVALNSNDKGRRANYRFMRSGAIISDISYCSCIELKGKRSDLIDFLRPMFPEGAGHTSLLSCIDSCKEVEVVMYKPHLYPYHCVGPVSLLWQPAVTEDQRVWLWTHPSICDEVLEIFKGELNSNALLAVGPVPTAISVNSLRDELLRFRLVGPKALSVIMSVLHFKEPCTKASETGLTSVGISEGERFLRSSQKWEEISATTSKRSWWYSNNRGTVAHPLNTGPVTHGLKQLASTDSDSLVSDGLAFGVVVEDPRLFTPVKRRNEGCPPPIKGKDWLLEMSTMLMKGSVMDHDGKTEVACDNLTEPHKGLFDNSVDALLSVPPEVLSLSYLWSASVRNDVSSSKIADSVINQVRGSFFNKPNEVDLGGEASAVPLMLVRKTYCCQNKRRPASVAVTGWDLIMPSNWGMSFWVPLIYHGARACGLRELASCTGLECLVPGFPEDYPDTHAGQTIAADKTTELENKYSRYPPDKRPNFGKLRIPYPFACEWSDILAQTCHQQGSKRVNREPSVGCKKIRLENDVWGDGEVRGHGDVRGDSEVRGHGDIRGDGDVRGDGEIQGGREGIAAFYVLRSVNDLDRLSRFIDTLFSKCWRGDRTPEKYDQLYTRYDIGRLVTRHNDSLVAVQLEVWSRGTLLPHSTISLPSTVDLFDIRAGGGMGTREPLCPRGLTIVEGENIYIGESQIPSKEVKLVQKQRKKMQRKFNQERKSEDGTSSTSIGTSPAPIEAYKLKVVQPSRLTIGRICTTVDYRYTSSRHSAIGHCTLAGIIELCKVCFVGNVRELVALSRGHNSQYVASLLRVYYDR